MQKRWNVYKNLPSVVKIVKLTFNGSAGSSFTEGQATLVSLERLPKILVGLEGTHDHAS